LKHAVAAIPKMPFTLVEEVLPVKQGLKPNFVDCLIAPFYKLKRYFQ